MQQEKHLKSCAFCTLFKMSMFFKPLSHWKWVGGHINSLNKQINKINKPCSWTACAGEGCICMCEYKILCNVSFGTGHGITFPSHSSILWRSGFRLGCYCLAAEFPRRVNFEPAIDGWSRLNSDTQQPDCSDLQWPMSACYFMPVCRQKENKGFGIVFLDLSGRCGCPSFPHQGKEL